MGPLGVHKMLARLVSILEFSLLVEVEKAITEFSAEQRLYIFENLQVELVP